MTRYIEIVAGTEDADRNPRMDPAAGDVMYNYGPDELPLQVTATDGVLLCTLGTRRVQITKQHWRQQAKDVAVINIVNNDRKRPALKG